MLPQQLFDAVHRRPFQPFRVVQPDGTTYDIRHPEMLMVGVGAAIVGLNLDPTSLLFERTVTLDLMHIIRIEPLPVSTQSQGNGQGGA